MEPGRMDEDAHERMPDDSRAFLQSVSPNNAYCNASSAHANQLPQEVRNTVFSSSSDSLPNSTSFPLGGYTNTWGNYEFPIDTLNTTEQLTPEQFAKLEEYINSLSQSTASSFGNVGSSGDAYLPHQNPLSNPSENCLAGGLDLKFNHNAESGRQMYSEAYSQWTSGSLNSAGSSSTGSLPTHFTEGTYNPFGMPSHSVFQTEGGNSQSSSQSSLFIGESNKILRNSGSSNSTMTCAGKPSFAEVAKNKGSQTKDSAFRNISSSNPKLLAEKKEKDVHIIGNSAMGQNIINGNKAATSERKKVKKSGGSHLHRSKSVPVEPAEIKPNSRYGLDTFDDRSMGNTNLREASRNGNSNSRKNSGSSVSSGISGMEEINLIDDKHCSDINSNSSCHGLKEDCDRFGGTTQSVQSNGRVNRDKKTSSKKLDGCNINNISSESGDNGTKASSTSSKSDGIYFDPRRIFQDSRDKNSISVQTNNEDYIPNNKQKLQPNKDTLLNKEKSKASVKSGSTKYINNDLRDNKKHTNIEQDHKENVQSGGHETGVRDSRQKATSATLNGGSNINNPGRNRGKTSTRPEATASHHQSRNGKLNNKKEKVIEQNFILGQWLLLAYEWILWCGKEFIYFLWNILKLVLSVGLLLLALIAHYSIIVCAKIWSFIQKKIPYLRKYKSNEDFDWSSPMSQQPRPKQQYGLKENIVLPSTGNEAMKRLLSCRGKDPYSILGVRGDASDDDIKKYYRKQAVLVHPDKNQQPGAEEAFKILGHAFDLIGSPEKRMEYNSHLEMKDAEDAMQEFADLLTKLHEKMQEASNLLRCDNCGGKHKRVPTDRPMYSARFCDRCNTRHSAKEGDVWAESRMLGFLWHYYACMEGKVYDITEWASCKRDNFKSMQANAHQVIYRLSTGGGKGKNNSRPGDANLEDFLTNLFHTAATSSPGGGGGQDSGNNHHQHQTGGYSANGQSNSGKSSTSKSSGAGGRKKKNKKH